MSFLDVGQGDAAVIESPTGRAVLIDGGGRPGHDPALGDDPGSRVVVPFLRSRGISTLDLMIATHPDDDHVQGLLAVCERLVVRAALDSGIPAPSTSPMGQLRALWKRQGVRVHQALRGQRFDLGGGAQLEVLHPGPEHLSGTRSDDNNNAIVTRLLYRQARVLFLADAEQEAEEALLRSEVPLEAQLIKLGHHGARTSTTEALLRRVAPQLAVLSCGRNNRFGHPHPETLKRLEAHKVRVFRTDQQGAILVETRGSEFALQPQTTLRSF